MITIATQFPKTAKTVQLFLVMTLVLFIAGVSLPILTLTKILIVSNEVSILTGLYQLIEEQQYFIFVVIFLFSIVLPLLKLYYLFLLSSNNTTNNKTYTKYLHLMHRYGRWSMLDVFVIAVLIMTVKLGALASVKIEPGMFFFTAAVILLMIITSVMVSLESKLKVAPDDQIKDIDSNKAPTTMNSASDFTRNLLAIHALWWYSASILIICFGTFMGAQYYPGGFDWYYTVASALASHKHNPDGSIWFAGSLSLSMLMLWQYFSSVKSGLSGVLPGAGFAFKSIRIGLVAGFLLGVERLIIHDLSQWVHKGHEIIALFTLLGIYIGILSLLIQIIRRNKRMVYPLFVIVSPLVAIGIIGMWLYVDQHDLGWVDTDWRDRGIPVWLSFAFWQWIAICLLWTGIGLLYLFTNKKQEP